MKSNKNFGAQLLTLPEIFASKYFTIPDYQRGYSWEKKQVQEMLQDIEHLSQEESSHYHFTGTLVLSRGKDDKSYDIVDGQQRLTTLIILIARLTNHLDRGSSDELTAKYVVRGTLGAEKNVLQLSSTMHIFFENVVVQDRPLDSNPITMEAQKRLLGAMQVIDTWLSSLQKKSLDVSVVRETIENRLGFLVYAPTKTAELGIMFEVINNRGKPLSELEKVKNLLIYNSVKLDAETLRREIDTAWSVILTNLNKAKKTSAADESAFLRYSLVVHLSLSKGDSQNGYDQIKKKFALEASLQEPKSANELVTKIREMTKFLVSASVWYARLYGQEHSDLSPVLAENLEQIRAQDSHASIMPTFLAVVIRHNENSHKLLSLLEIINFRVYMARGVTGRNDTGQAWLFGDAADYFHGRLVDKLRADDYPKSIKTEDQALEFRLTEFAVCHSSDAVFAKSFKLDKSGNDDFYKWGGIRYFLMNYEQHLQPTKTIAIDKIVKIRAEGRSSDYLSVEHLWSTANRSSKGQNDRKNDLFEKRRLGNFVLLELRLNIQGSDDDLDKKIARYKGNSTTEPETDLEQVRNICKIAKRAYKKSSSISQTKNYYLNLYQKIIDQNEIKYIDFALQRWSVWEYLGYSKVSKWYEPEDE